MNNKKEKIANIILELSNTETCEQCVNEKICGDKKYSYCIHNDYCLSKEATLKVAEQIIDILKEE